MIIESGKRYLKVALFIIIILTVLIYALFRSIDFLQGPSITIQSPQNGQTLNEPLLKIIGRAEHVAFITLNDRQIFVDENGALKEELLLQKGYNIISIKATDRFNRKVEKRLELIYQ
ncbi:MAG: hypothetical protein Q7S34_03265 [bacterium]|nr:hypothetical protein [bacterium]